jgi:hypothetical protein
VGNIYLPNGFDESQSYAALGLVTADSSVKEQIGAIYTEKLASRGFVALGLRPFLSKRKRPIRYRDSSVRCRPPRTEKRWLAADLIERARSTKLKSRSRGLHAQSRDADHRSR